MIQKNLLIILLAFSILPLFFLSGCQTTLTTETNSQSINQENKQIEIKTAELNEQKPVSRIVFGSCSHQKKPQPIWKIMLEHKPDLYIGMGDNIYSSKPEDRPLSMAYRLQSQIPEYATFRAIVPIVATWDDHDSGKGDGGKENSDLAEAKKEFLSFFPNDMKKISKDIKGIYHSFIVGQKDQQVQIILLDGRTYRDELEKTENPPYPPGQYIPTKNTKKNYLGSEQWSWLENELSKKANLRILVSGVQFIAEEHGFEKWGLFPHEKQRLIEILKKKNIRNLFIISGDRHQAEIDKMTLTKKIDLFDVTASGINRESNLKENNKYRLGGVVSEHNFGQADINWKTKKVELKVFDVNGAERLKSVFHFH